MIFIGFILALLFLVVCGLKIAWYAARLVIGLILLAHSALNVWLWDPGEPQEDGQERERIIYMVPPRRRALAANEN